MLNGIVSIPVSTQQSEFSSNPYFSSTISIARSSLPIAIHRGVTNQPASGRRLVAAPSSERTRLEQVVANSREINAALKLPEVQEKALQFGLDARGTTPEDMRERMVADIAKWEAVIEKAGLERQ